MLRGAYSEGGGGGLGEFHHCEMNLPKTTTCIYTACIQHACAFTHTSTYTAGKDYFPGKLCIHRHVQKPRAGERGIVGLGLNISGPRIGVELIPGQYITHMETG